MHEDASKSILTETQPSTSATPSLNLEKQVCIEGSGATGFTQLCNFGCKYGVSREVFPHVCYVANF